MKEAGVRPQETLMIGDSDVDIRTAHNAGVWSMGCAYGLAPHTLVADPPDCLVESPADWPLALAGEQKNLACKGQESR
jgi:phosphoglycolate phosphatase